MNSRRVFVALELPSELRQKLIELPRLIGTPDAKVRWVDPTQMHLTLLFAGEATDEQVDALTRAVTEAEKSFSPIRLGIGGLGAFPSRRNPRVIWVGINESEPLARLHMDIWNAGAGTGLEREDRDFAPHLTLGRVKFVPPRSPLLRRLQSVHVETFYYLFDTLTLFESKLTPEGPEYTPLQRVRFTGGRKPQGF